MTSADSVSFYTSGSHAPIPDVQILFWGREGSYYLSYMQAVDYIDSFADLGMKYVFYPKPRWTFLNLEVWDD